MSRYLAASFGILVLTLSCARRLPPAAVIPGGANQSNIVRQTANAIDAGDGDGVMARLRREIIDDPAAIEPRLALGLRYEQAGSYELALEHYRLALERTPDSAAAATRAVRALRSLHLDGDALRLVETFTAAYPMQSAEVHSWLGILKDERGEHKEAEKAHRAALAIGPESDSLRNNLGYNLLLQGKSDEAAVELLRALELRPQSELARNNLALALARGKTDDALRQWERIGDKASAHNNLGAALMEQGRYDEARAEFEMALQSQSTHGPARRNLAALAALDGGTASGAVKRRSFWRRLGAALKTAL